MSIAGLWIVWNSGQDGEVGALCALKNSTHQLPASCGLYLADDSLCSKEELVVLILEMVTVCCVIPNDEC